MYKYTEKQFASQFFNMGRLRIGTLHNFRRTEHKRGIVDVDEGKKSVSHHIDVLHIADSQAPENDGNIDFRSLDAFQAVSLNNGSNILFKNVRLTKKIESQDFFVYSTSASRSRKTMREFEGADTCIEIFDPDNFYKLLTKPLNSITPVRFLGVKAVTYKNRSEEWNGVDSGTHPSLIKSTDYIPQFEVRAIWSPLVESTIEPVITAHCRLGEFCREIHL
ncbi:hypothetical protein [Rhodoferax sp.]|uniref:hypothetical protein n=1 Tax=Rhodoferax sp. TaxID=50421 RepID=UPI0026393B0D|nr:hypothetical protein [Rhodoferax sp.]MDD3937386.1 hypothetical protein [Rhodoferax sp.]